MQNSIRSLRWRLPRILNQRESDGLTLSVGAPDAMAQAAAGTTKAA